MFCINIVGLPAGAAPNLLVIKMSPVAGLLFVLFPNTDTL